MSWVHAYVVLALQSEFTPDLLPPQVPVMVILAPFRCSARSVPAPSPTAALFFAMATFALVRSCAGAKAAGAGAQCGLGCVLRSWETSQSPEQFQSASSSLFPGVSKQACACFLRVESRFPTALLLLPLVFKPPKGTHLPGVKPQVWGSPQYVT